MADTEVTRNEFEAAVFARVVDRTIAMGWEPTEKNLRRYVEQAKEEVLVSPEREGSFGFDTEWNRLECLAAADVISRKKLLPSG